MDNEFYNTEEPFLASLPPYNWLKEAKIYNHNYQKIPIQWLTKSIDVIVLNFSLRGRDRNGCMNFFYEIYENAKFLNMPVEVINVPMDSAKENMCIGFDQQANWFTLLFNDPLILTLQFMYQIYSVPHLVVIRPDGSLIASDGISDVDEYGKNALIVWLSNITNLKSIKRFSKEKHMYGPKWRFQSAGDGKADKVDYHRKFSVMPKQDEITTSIGLSLVASTITLSG